MFSAGVRTSGEHDVQPAVDQRFRAENRRGHFRLHALRCAGWSLEHVYGDVVHQRHPRLRFLDLRSERAHDPQRGNAALGNRRVFFICARLAGRFIFFSLYLGLSRRSGVSPATAIDGNSRWWARYKTSVSSSAWCSLDIYLTGERSAQYPWGFN